jgi:hypothetical protein
MSYKIEILIVADKTGASLNHLTRVRVSAQAYKMEECDTYVKRKEDGKKKRLDKTPAAGLDMDAVQKQRLERRAARKATSELIKKDTARREAEEAARKRREEGWAGEAARWLAEYTARQKAAEKAAEEARVAATIERVHRAAKAVKQRWHPEKIAAEDA